MLRKIGHRNYDEVGSIDQVGMGRLAKVYSSTINKRINVEAKRENEVDLSIPHLEVLQKKLSEEMNNEPDGVSGHLPVASVFDALQIIKARKDAKRNVGLRALSGYLQSIWKKDRTANLTANTFLNLKDHYNRNYPKSGMDGVFDEIADKGYFTLQLSDLLHIASQIEDQEDFDYMMVKCGLNGKQPHQIKSRKFILATINGENV